MQRTVTVGDPRAWYFGVTWSPEGTLFASRRDGENCEIVRIAGSATDIVHAFPWCELTPTNLMISPDGKRVVFLAERERQSMWRQDLER